MNNDDTLKLMMSMIDDSRYSNDPDAERTMANLVEMMRTYTSEWQARDQGDEWFDDLEDDDGSDANDVPDTRSDDEKYMDRIGI